MSRKRNMLSVIVASGEPDIFKIWLKSTFQELLRHEFVRILLVPWGMHEKIIRRLAPKVIRICDPSHGTSLEACRNAVLDSLRRYDKTDLVAFLDDDTFVNPSWVDAMIASADTHQDIDAFATVVFTDGWREMQSQGHVFVRGAPRDRGYRGKDLERPILCPCGNSAVVRWKALERIWVVDDHAWDPLFNQDQTCFDFGLKLVLTGSRTMVVPGAVSQHRGYLFRDAVWREKNGKDKVVRQLTARYLLYRKFFTEDLEKEAIVALNNRLECWRKRGYPGFRDYVKGEDVDEAIKEAWDRANGLASQIKCIAWKSKMAEFENPKLLLDLNLNSMSTL